MSIERPRHTEATCVKLFEHFFIDAQVLLAEFAPNGWKKCPLFFIFHPTPQQQYEETLRIHKNMPSLLRHADKQDESKEPKLDDFCP